MQVDLVPVETLNENLGTYQEGAILTALGGASPVSS